DSLKNSTNYLKGLQINLIKYNFYDADYCKMMEEDELNKDSYDDYRYKSSDNNSYLDAGGGMEWSDPSLFFGD
ncbi:MAG: hypothetical protein D4R43_02320, partial [Sphingobacteriales bacterium]